MEVCLSHEDHWRRSGNTMVSGNAFLDGEYLPTERLAARLSDVGSSEELQKLLSRANGFFSVIHETSEGVCAAVDHVRSWPLYYTVTDDAYVSDSAEWVHSAGARRGYDPVAATEYLFTCFVPGRDTLSRDVKQVQAGECVTLQSGSSCQSVRNERYFVHSPNETATPTDEDELAQVLLAATNRLLEHAAGRTILLGLSTGYDSRLIALMLSRLGYDDVVTYTSHVAASGPEEVARAKRLADDLGFEHIEVDSTGSDFGGIEPADRLAFADEAGYLSEYPHVYKLLLPRKLRDAGVDPEAVVHVLGHHLLGSGTFLPPWVRNQRTLDREEFIDLLWALHYSNWETPSEPAWETLFKGRLLKRVPVDLYQGGTVEPTPDAVSGFECWYWQERLPKYIIARREYELLGFDVWYPLLDRELFSFFQVSNYRDRVGKRALKTHVRQLESRIRGSTDLGVEEGETSRSLADVAWERAVGTVKTAPEPATRFARRAYNRYKSKDAYGQDPRHAIVSKDKFDSISFPKSYSGSLYRPLLLLYLYDNGLFDLPEATEFDRALYGD